MRVFPPCLPHNTQKASRCREALGRAQKAGSLTALVGVMPRTAAIAPAVAVPGPITRPVAASVSPGTGIFATGGPAPSLTAAGSIAARTSPVTGGAGTRTAPVRAGTVAIARFCHGRKSLHESQSHNRQAKGSKKLPAIHSSLLLPVSGAFSVCCKRSIYRARGGQALLSALPRRPPVQNLTRPPFRGQTLYKNCARLPAVAMRGAIRILRP